MSPSEFAQRYLLKPAHDADMAALIELLTGKPGGQVKQSQSEVYVSSKTHQAKLMPTGCLSVTRSDVLAHMPRPPDTSFVSKDVVRNDRWYFEGCRLVYSYRDGGELKSVSLVGEVPAVGASA